MLSRLTRLVSITFLTMSRPMYEMACRAQPSCCQGKTGRGIIGTGVAWWLIACVAVAMTVCGAGLLLPKLCEGVAREAAIADREVHVAANPVLLHHLRQRTQRPGRLALAHVAPARQTRALIGAIGPATLGVHACEGRASHQSAELHLHRRVSEVGEHDVRRR